MNAVLCELSVAGTCEATVPLSPGALQAVARHLLWPSFTSGTFWMLVVAGAVRNIAGYALGAWLPTFFVVQYCVSSADYGLKAGLVVLFGGTTGAFLGGFVADRWDLWCTHCMSQ